MIRFQQIEMIETSQHSFNENFREYDIICKNKILHENEKFQIRLGYELGDRW